MSGTSSEHRPPNAPPPPDSPTRRRLKLAIMIVVLGPILLFSLYHLARGAAKMLEGKPVGYEQRDHRTGEIRE